MPLDEALAWTSRDAVKAHLKITATDLDDEIDTKINEASRLLQSFIGHSLKTDTYTEYFDGDCTNTLLVSNYPVQSVTSIHDDTARVFGDDKLIDSGDYVFDSNENENVGTIRLFKGHGIFYRGVQNIKVVYVAGFDEVPEDAELSCKQLVAWLMNRAGTEGQTSASLGGKSETYEMDDIPEYIKRGVRRYRKIAA